MVVTNRIETIPRVGDLTSIRWGKAGDYTAALAHSVRAIYAHYVGPYDGNPTNLSPRAPIAAGERSSVQP